MSQPNAESAYSHLHDPAVHYGLRLTLDMDGDAPPALSYACDVGAVVSLRRPEAGWHIVQGIPDVFNQAAVAVDFGSAEGAVCGEYGGPPAARVKVLYVPGSGAVEVFTYGPDGGGANVRGRVVVTLIANRLTPDIAALPTN